MQKIKIITPFTKHSLPAMASIPPFLSLFIFTSILLARASLILHHSDHSTLLTIQKDLGIIYGKGSEMDNPCYIHGVVCDQKLILKNSYVLRITRIIFNSLQLDGFLCPSIGQLSELKELSLPNNHLVGEIPIQLLHCKKLEILKLQNNRLSGKVPLELSSLTLLRVLDLSSNKLSGTLNFLKHFPNLEELSLANNMFTGKIPASPRSYKNLRFFNISGNSYLEDNQSAEFTAKDNFVVPKRYIFAESNPIGPASAPSRSTVGVAEAPSPKASPKQKRKKRDAKWWVLVFLIGSISGFVAGTVLSLLLKVLVVMIKGEGTDTGPAIFSQMIKAEDLAFLEKEDGLASLEVIGRGGCGEVYKAELAGNNGKMIAIKKIVQPPMDTVKLTNEDTKSLNRKMRQIKAEIQIVGQIRHRNLVPLLAHVSRPDCHYLVYEFMKNGSVEGLIRQVAEGTLQPDWLLRHKIAIGVATGLEYLHIDHSPHIIHRDLKPANVLLDEDMEARVADFGLSKVVPEAQTHITSTNIAGTLGYIAPEYHQTMKFTTKCDIYSYGVMLGTLVIGRLPSDMFFQQTREINFVKWMRMMMTSEDPKEAIDPKLRGNGFEEQMLQVLMIACYCTRDNPKDRPTSKEVKIMLAQIQH